MPKDKYTRISAIYILVNKKNSKVYIGQTSDIRRRQKDHFKALHNGTHRNRYLQRAFNKYGAINFEFMVLEYCPVEQLDEREQHYLDIYIPKGICYNIASDAKVPSRGAVRSAETREKIRQANLGKKLSDEHKRKISIGGKGHRGSNKGGHVSQEVRQKMSDAQKGKIVTAETREKLSAAAVIREAKRRLRRLNGETN